MGENKIVVATKLTPEEYEKFKLMKQILFKLGYIENESDYRALRFCINFMMDAFVKAIDNAEKMAGTEVSKW